MPVNFNSVLGFRYGVFDPRRTPDLYDVITSNGDDLTDRMQVDALAGEIQEVLDKYGHVRDGVARDLAEDAIQEMDDWGEDITDHEYEYEDGDAVFLLTELGGAPLCYVTSSRYIVKCVVCSPCVPGAGDLDSPDSNGDWALAPGPESLQQIANDLGVELEAAKITANGYIERLFTVEPQAQG